MHTGKMTLMSRNSKTPKSWGVLRPPNKKKDHIPRRKHMPLEYTSKSRFSSFELYLTRRRVPVQVRTRKDRSRKQKIRSRPLNLKGGLQLGDTHEGRLELSARGQPWYDDREPISSREDFYRRKIVEQADSSPRVVIDDQVRRQVLTRRAKAWKKAAKHRRRASSSTNEASSVPGNAGAGDEKHTLAIPVIDA